VAALRMVWRSKQEEVEQSKAKPEAVGARRARRKGKRKKEGQNRRGREGETGGRACDCFVLRMSAVQSSYMAGLRLPWSNGHNGKLRSI
jgi:hypothetical protein